MTTNIETVVTPITQHVAAVENNAAAVVETAAERVDEAQAVAHTIAEAAMQTRVGEAVTDVQEELDQWQQRTVAVEQENAFLRGKMETLEAQLLSLTEATISTPPPSAPEPEPEPTAVPVEVIPEVIPEPIVTVAESVAPEVRERKRRWL